MLVGADFRELHSLAPKYGPIFPGKERGHQPPGAEFDGFDLLENFGGDGHGLKEVKREE
jgi:hypothetical protein